MLGLRQIDAAQKQCQLLAAQYDLLHAAVPLRPTKSSSVQLLCTYPKPASVIYKKLHAIVSRIRENKHMTAFRIAAKMIAYKAVETIEVFAHVRRAGCNIDPRRRSKPEHRLHPVQHGQQTFQCPRIKTTTYFDPAAASQFNYKRAIAPGDAVGILSCERNHFDGNKRPASRLPSTMHAQTIFIQRPDRQASLLAECRSHQSARFILRNKSLDLGPATPLLHHSRFTHGSSPPLIAEQEQGALLRRIRTFVEPLLGSVISVALAP